MTRKQAYAGNKKKLKKVFLAADFYKKDLIGCPYMIKKDNTMNINLDVKSNLAKLLALQKISQYNTIM